MTNFRKHVWEWYQQGLIANDKVGNAFSVADSLQKPVDWQRHIGQVLLWLGTLCFAVGVIFFFAFNWQALSKFGKFALLQSLIVISSFAYAWLRWQTRLSNPTSFGANKANAALSAVAVLLGALLALVGQTYQTGADPWQLFAIWAVFIIPLAYLSGFQWLWVMFVGLLNLALLLYFQISFRDWWSIGDSFSPFQYFAMINSVVYLLLLFADKCKLAHFHAPHGQSISIFFACSAVTWMGVIHALHDSSSLFYWGYTALILLISRFVVFQLLPLALASFSAIAVLTVHISSNIFTDGNPFASFFLIAIFIIGSSAGVSIWLNKVRVLFHDSSINPSKEALS